MQGIAYFKQVFASKLISKSFFNHGNVWWKSGTHTTMWIWFEKLSFNQVVIATYHNPTFTTEMADWISLLEIMDI